MTFVGKLLVVVQLVLSICFMAFAGAVYTFQTKWREKYDTTNASLTQKSAQLQAAEDTLRKYRELSTTALNVARAADADFTFDTAGDVVEQSLTAFEGKVEEAQTLLVERDAAITARNRAQTALEQAETEKVVAIKETDLAGQAKDAADTRSSLLEEVYLSAQDRLDVQEDALRKTEDERFALERALEETSRRYNNLLGENARLRKLLIAGGFDPDKEPENRDAPPPEVEGLVLNTKKTRSTELIEISIGSDDGLKDGDDLFVFRTSDAKYLGRIKIVLVTPDRAVGSVTERSPNGVIQRGDNVATKL